MESGDADNTCEKGVIDSQSLKNEETLQDIEVDDMSPEASKSMPVKRFQFSPGMVIIIPSVQNHLINFVISFVLD